MEKQLLNNKSQNIKDLILINQNIGIFTHIDPDGDAMGSICALSLALKKMGKNIKPYFSGIIPTNLSFLPLPFFEERFLSSIELVIVLDCADLSRTGYMNEILNLNKKIINIDHHPQESPFGDVNIVETNLTSTSEIIFHLLEVLEINIDKDLANCLLTGILSDTGSFMHSNTTKDSLEIAAFLISRGANIKQIAENTFRKKTISTLKLWGRVLSRIKNDRNKGIVSSVITKKDLEECSATKEDLEGVVNLINSVPEAKAALLLREDEDQIRGSLRSENGGLDVRRVANIFGGGGHVRASGFKIKGKLKETEEGWEIIED